MVILSPTLLLAVGLAVLIGLSGWIWWLRRPPMLTRRVILQLDGDQALSGVLWRVHGDWFVLRDTLLLQPDGARVPMDGELVVHRRSVVFAQVPDGGQQLRQPG